MQKLLIHSQGESEHGIQIKNFIETRLPFEAGLSFDLAQSEAQLLQRSTQLLIFETKILTADDLQYLQNLRTLGYAYPFLVVAEKSAVPSFLQNLDKWKAHYLEKPFEFKSLRGLVQKLMSTRLVPQQKHRRYKTQQSATLETYVSGDVITSQMFNLSVGGAYVELNNKDRVSIGDLVRLKVKLDHLEREHCVNARVVWTTHKGLNGNGFGVGVRFIKGNDIYRQLMDKV